MLLVKNLKFLHYSFLGQIGLEIVVGDFLQRNYALTVYRYKNIDFTWSPNYVIPKELAHDFG